MTVSSPRIFSCRNLCVAMLLALAVPLLLDRAPLFAAEPRQVVGEQYMVVTDSPPASQVGADVLADGGNAVDSAVAVAFALAVTWPEAGNIGGGGFMLVKPPDERPVCIDYREVAPLAAKADMYQPGESTHTTRMVGVPGTVAGLGLAHRKYGSLPWKRLVMPAARLAEQGFPVDEHLADSLNSVLAIPEVRRLPRFDELRRAYGRADGQPWQAGDSLRLPQLAATLRQIAQQGPEAFYQGKIAEQIVAEMRRSEGLITAEDLRRYEAKLRPCIHGEYRGYDVYGPPPPSSGGITLVETLNILSHFNLAEHPRQSPETMHLLAEALRRSFRDRAAHLGDADFVEIPDHLTTAQHPQQWADSIDRQRATDSRKLAGEIKITDESPDTTHFSIIDGDGLAVSNTYTLEQAWGSRIVVPGAGFLVNNEMGDFNWVAGRTTPTGRIGTPANLIEPRKRMLSSQCPVIVCRDGRAVLITGSPGGRSIISTVLQTIVNHVDYQMSPRENLAQARMHHQWLPDALQYEKAGKEEFAATVEALTRMGHQVVPAPARGQGSAHSIWIDPSTGSRTGVADHRRGGQAVGK